ncbi:hypothetical protein PRZ48_006727 [Zasmidium cellare]|uniref:AB hydrolase-1 domain-containing protein n=1 Tax=Zasmidium cellare TaxID=395010 RepID=A0ABR0ENV8_ZASCE|nr:hypothetical protein PRZ48_006727 [Zasmidium cellare]
MPENPAEKFYNDIHDKETLDRLVSSLKPQSFSAFWGKAAYMPWCFVDSTQDNALPFHAQEGMVANAKRAIAERGDKVTLHDVTLQTSHSPFLSQGHKVAEILRKAGGESL